MWHVMQMTLLLGEAMIRVNAFVTSVVAGVGLVLLAVLLVELSTFKQKVRLESLV